jgi:hypothetical protein
LGPATAGALSNGALNSTTAAQVPNKRKIPLLRVMHIVFIVSAPGIYSYRDFPVAHAAANPEIV